MRRQVTDANLQLGRILPARFPHIFGPNEDQAPCPLPPCPLPPTVHPTVFLGLIRFEFLGFMHESVTAVLTRPLPSSRSTRPRRRAPSAR
jgi:hypothetical protein